MALRDIGRYRYQDRPLAQDASGVLYEGTDTNTGEAVYIKEMRSRSREQGTGNSTAALQGIAHSTLAPVRDEVVLGRERYVMVIKPEGELLSHCLPALRQEGIWGRYQMLCALVDVCKAVESLHNTDLVHGGINPTAIVVRRGDHAQAWLLCFEPFAPCPTNHYLKKGDNQLFYLAQEQLRGGGDFASDVYALGMLIYTGFGTAPPFAGESPYQLAEQVVWGDLAPFDPYLDDLDTALGQAIAPEIEAIGAVAARALQRNPGARYETVGEMHRALQQITRRLSPIALGRMLYQNGHFDLAATVLEEARLRPDTSWEANILLGRIYGFELNDYGKGVTAFKRALKQKPFLDSARLGLAELYAQHGRYNLAKREFTEMLKKRPDDLQLMMGYAMILWRSGNQQGALNILRKAQETSPYFLSAYATAIQVSLGQQNLKEAEVDCNNALKRIVKVIERGNLDPRQVAEIYFLRGLLHHERGRNALSIRWLKKALEQMPVHPQSHNLLAELYAEVGQMDKALHHLLTSLNISPDQRGIMDVITRIFVSQAKQEQKSRTA